MRSGWPLSGQLPGRLKLAVPAALREVAVETARKP